MNTHMHIARTPEPHIAASRSRRRRTLLALLVVASAYLLAAIPASAADTTPATPANAAAPAVQVPMHDYPARAVAYYGVAKTEPIVMVYDQAEVARYNAAAVAYTGRTLIIVGDAYMNGTPDYQCEVFTHEYGHLLGLDDNAHYAIDPLFVMGSDTRTPQCAELRLTDPPTIARDSTAATRADILLTRRYRARGRRSRCLLRANNRFHRKARIRARHACWTRYHRAVR